MKKKKGFHFTVYDDSKKQNKNFIHILVCLMLFNGTDLTGRLAKTCSDLFLTYLILDAYKVDVRL